MVSLLSPMIPGSYDLSTPCSNIILESWIKGFAIEVPFRAEHSIVFLFSVDSIVVDIHVIYHLLYEEVFLMKVERCTTL